MKRTVSIAEARSNLPSLLHAVEEGETVAITRRGRPVAIVLSVGAYERLAAGKGVFTSSYRAWRESIDPDDLDLNRDYFQPLRDRSTGRPVDL